MKSENFIDFVETKNYLVQVQDRQKQEQPKTIVVPRSHLSAFLAATLNGTSNVCIISSVETFEVKENGNICQE